ncbi:hypothetical protein E2C01_092602 [Portunus trituberculatus]|uniref:Uncharacterized protein n=1 Tax=Portunus trituberculatus TaxID=210409 RepID=A0A5B7JVW2_PORTR|nr:hypothetical protein [Portunus trituberculatus]
MLASAVQMSEINSPSLLISGSPTSRALRYRVLLSTPQMVAQGSATMWPQCLTHRSPGMT